MSKQKRICLLLLSAIVCDAHAQAHVLPIKEWHNANDSTLVLYISGDGGLNKFSVALCNAIALSGFHVTAMNAKAYFADKKTPMETTLDITTYLESQFKNRPNQRLVFAGYSFGADVMPFIVNRLPGSLKSKLVSVVLLSPSSTTDFEIHWLDMFGSNIERSMDVVTEINKMQQQKTTIIVGSDETDFPLTKVKLQNYTTETLPGGHHFGSNTDEVARAMVKYFK